MDILLDAYFIFKKIVVEIGFILFASFVVFCFYNYIRVIFIEKEINRIRKEQETEIDELTKNSIGTAMITEVYNRFVAAIIRKNKPKIEKLELKRKFILEKIPFFK